MVTLRDHAEKKAAATRTDLGAVRRAQRYLDAGPDQGQRTPDTTKRPGMVVDLAAWQASDAGRDAAFRALLAAVEATELPPATPLIEPSHIWHMPR